MKMRFQQVQWRLVAACTIIYTAAYLNRLNLAAALSGVITALDITAAQGGLLQTCFAIVYAAGQMVNGAIVDRVDPVRHMCIGVIGSGLCNLLLGLSPSYVPMVALCLFNGAFQSMLWTPILRMIALHFADQKSRSTANLIISVALVAAHLGAWAISGYLGSILSWRFSFIVPALVAVPLLLIAMLLFRGVSRGEKQPSAPRQPKQHARQKQPGLLHLFAVSGFLVMLVSCVLFGFVRDGIKTWTPTILASLSNGNAMAATTLSLVLPPVNAMGMVIAYLIQRNGRVHNRRLIALMLLVGACFCLPLMGLRSMLLAVLFLGCSCACMAGLEPVLTGLVPLEYDKENLIGMTAGLIDSLIYVGSAMAGVLAGTIYDNLGVNALYVCWAVAAAAGAVCSLASGAMMRRYHISRPS